MPHGIPIHVLVLHKRANNPVYGRSRNPSTRADLVNPEAARAIPQKVEDLK
jgi:hypothetical protein